MAITLLQFNKIQQRIWNDSVSGTAYTWDEIVDLAREFDANTTIGTPESQLNPEQIVLGCLYGLIDYGLFVYSTVGDDDDIDNWRFTRVDSPTIAEPPETPTFTIPVAVQGTTPSGNASGTY